MSRGNWVSAIAPFFSFVALLFLGMGLANGLGFAFAVFAFRAQSLSNPLLASSFGSDFVKISAYANYLKTGLQNILPARSNRLLINAVLEAASATLLLVGAAFVLSIGLGLALGFLATRRPSPRPPGWITALNALGQSAPSFVIAALAALAISAQFGIPSLLVNTGAAPSPLQIALALGALSIRPMMGIAALTATLLADELGKPYATAAKSFGYSRRAIITKAVFRNIVMPVTLYAAASLRALLVEAFVIEWLFQIKGLGWLFAAAIVPNGIGQGGGTSLYLHPPLLATLFSVYAFLFIVINQMADAIARRADPRG